MGHESGGNAMWHCQPAISQNVGIAGKPLGANHEFGNRNTLGK